MKRGTPAHPKTEALADLLEIPIPYAVGLVEMLFHFTDQYAPRGDVGRFTDPQIARKLAWDGDPEALISALVMCGGPGQCGFLDPHEVHRLVVHDWHDHAPDYTKKKANGAKGIEATGWAVDDEPEAEGETEAVEYIEDSEDSESFQKIPENSGLPYQTLPSQTLPNQAKGVRRARKKSARGSAKKNKTAVPEHLSQEDTLEVQAWARKKDPPLSDEQLEYGWGVYSAKAKANGYRYVDHAAGFKNALGASGEAWALKGFGASRNGEPESPAQAKQRRNHEAAQEAMRRFDARNGPEQLTALDGGKS